MMPAGKYWIGDLCYVMHDEWDEVCNFIDSEGEFVLKSGVKYAIYSTQFGDGEYPSTTGRYLGVDSGTIGCILVSDIDQTNQNNDIYSGAVVDFDAPFDTENFAGTIVFGHVQVFTGDEE